MALNKIVRNAVIAIGNFDGVHKGHQSIFKLGKKIAKRNKQKFGVITFSFISKPKIFTNYNVRWI